MFGTYSLIIKNIRSFSPLFPDCYLEVYGLDITSVIILNLCLVFQNQRENVGPSCDGWTRGTRGILEDTTPEPEL